MLYANLMSFEEEIIESKLIKIRNGIGRGYFDLDRSYPEGSYQIRAYTEWNKNFENDFVFEKYIQVFSGSDRENNLQPITNIRRVNTTATENSFKIDAFPQLIDDAHKSSLKFFCDY